MRFSVLRSNPTVFSRALPINRKFILGPSSKLLRRRQILPSVSNITNPTGSWVKPEIRAIRQQICGKPKSIPGILHRTRHTEISDHQPTISSSSSSAEQHLEPRDVSDPRLIFSNSEHKRLDTNTHQYNFLPRATVSYKRVITTVMFNIQSRDPICALPSRPDG